MYLQGDGLLCNKCRVKRSPDRKSSASSTQPDIVSEDWLRPLPEKWSWMELGHKDGKLQVFYSDHLVTLLTQVRHLTVLGFVVPTEVQHTAAIYDILGNVSGQPTNMDEFCYLLNCMWPHNCHHS